MLAGQHKLVLVLVRCSRKLAQFLKILSVMEGGFGDLCLKGQL